ncbi:MAG TPA: hypothetical protein VFQ68_41840 [Streptosporangiaceae bacterium]|nr:hypothetical protein [Streptosporangiaceae bacterium]
MSSDLDALRSLIREIISDVLPGGLPGSPPAAETVNLSTDDDLAAFVKRLLELGPDEREEVRSGRKRFRLAVTPGPRVQAARPSEASRPGETGRAREASAVRRIERGAVTERVINAAAQAGERLVLGRGAVLTPLARDRARASGVPIEKER